MKKSELRNIIREELNKSMKEQFDLVLPDGTINGGPDPKKKKKEENFEPVLTMDFAPYVGESNDINPVKMDLKIEKHSKYDKVFIDVYNYLTTMDYDDVLKKIKSKYPDLLMGRGGHHIWFKDKDNIHDRLAIITF